MSKDDEKKKQEAIFAKIQNSLRMESARLPAPWINHTALAVTDGGQIRLTFSEQDITAEKGYARASVTMSPACAQQLADLISQFVKRVEGGVH